MQSPALSKCHNIISIIFVIRQVFCRILHTSLSTCVCLSYQYRCLVASSASKSFKCLENKNGERHSPCLTLIFGVKSSPRQPLCRTLVLTLLYTDFMMLNMLPRTPIFNSLNQSISLTTKSNAFVKSMTVQYYLKYE